MKKSEYKKQLEEQKNAPQPPITYYRLNCKTKQYATGGCQSCWHCNECGRAGCDNLYWLRREDKIETIQCDLEEG
jgi:hypothetical protein